MNPCILVVEDDAGLREALVDTLLLSSFTVLQASSGEEALLLLKKHTVDLVLTDVQMGSMSGLMLLRSIKKQWSQLPVILMTAFGTIHDAVDAMKEGACDYLAKPFTPQSLLSVIGRYIKADSQSLDTPIAGDPASLALLSLAQRVAQSDATVMIMGPSGSGKEVLARYVHQQSQRKDAAFVAINCAAIPENMLEATLFGYEKGAFTGAVAATPGKFEQAQQGTLLLDEITEMDLSLQTKLLRVLQEREVERLGGRKTIALDVRVLATSNRDLAQAVADGVFREDLYYRLNVFPIQWLPLAQRPGDILPLIQHLIAKHWQHHPCNGKHPVPELTVEAQHMLLSHHWPGNVRELENVVQRALILFIANPNDSANSVIDADHILLHNGGLSVPTSVPVESQPLANSQAENPAAITIESRQADNLQTNEPQTPQDNLSTGLMQQEHRMILETLRACAGSRKDVAERLGISPRTLRYKLAKMRDEGIQIPA